MKWVKRMLGLNVAPAYEPAIHLDRDFLGRLEAHIGRDSLTEIAADSLIELKDRFCRLDELAQAGDIEAIARLSHDIAGIAGNMGLREVHGAAIDTNRRARFDEDCDPERLVHALRAAGPDALAALRAFLDERRFGSQNRN